MIKLMKNAAVVADWRWRVDFQVSRGKLRGFEQREPARGLAIGQALIITSSARSLWNLSPTRLKSSQGWRNAHPVALLKKSALFRNPYTNGLKRPCL